jgi:DNA-binding SARP family transcriptional activator
VAQTYGLKFQGQDVSLDKRTELNLTPDDYLKFEDEFEISFDYKIDAGTRNSLFGYVIRIINKENNNIDLLSTPTPYPQLDLVIGVSNSIIPTIDPESTINKWINLRIKFFLAEDRLIFYTPDSFYVHEEIGFNKRDEFKIIFGANDYNQFKTTDVPSITLKNIKISEKGILRYQWPLDEMEGNNAVDKLKKHNAVVKNPVWLRLRHQSWQVNFEKEIEGHLMVTVDNRNERIFMVGTNELLIYSGIDNSIQTIKYQKKPLFITTSYSSIYNPDDNKIYCYLVDGDPVYSLDIETGKWNDTETTSERYTSYRHHNRYYNPKDSSVYLFGGYGFHKYNNEIRKIDLSNGTFNDLQTNDSIFLPRYLAGLGSLNDTIYIFGGYGSETGNQLINPQSYYDLFGYSVNNENFFKKFEIPRLIDDMTVANSMIIDSINRNYYALVFEKSKFDGYLQLIRGNLDLPTVEKVGDVIPFQFLDVRSFAALFHLPKQKKLFAYTSYYTESNKTRSSIYSISYPPDRFESEIESEKQNSFIYLILAVTCLLLLALAGWYFTKKKRRHVLHSANNEDKLTETEQEINPSGSLPEELNYQLIFFGGFQVFDKDFVDITNKFSPLLKELFLLIMLNTFKNNKGIASEKIAEILWYDKSEKSARNNKAVNIAKLRNILTEIGGCELTKKTGYWKIVSENKKNKSDYLDFLHITASKRNLTKQNIIQLIRITEKGAFLHNVQYEWLDEFKASVSETIIDTLIEFANTCDIKKDADFIIHLTDCVFNFDLINEDAMILKCKAEYCMGKHSLAKSTYERFFKEYQIMYNQEYENSFLDILELKE